MAKKGVSPLFGYNSTAMYQVPVGNGAFGMASLHNAAVKAVQAQTQIVKSSPGRFPNGKRPKPLNK